MGGKAGLMTESNVLFLAVAAQRDARESAATLTQLAHQIMSAAVRQPQIAHQEVKTVMAGPFQRCRDISGGFDKLTSSQLPALNKALSGAGAHPLAVPAETAFDDDDVPGHGSGGALAGRRDPDAMGEVVLPKNLRLWN